MRIREAIQRWRKEKRFRARRISEMASVHREQLDKSTQSKRLPITRVKFQPKLKTKLFIYQCFRKINFLQLNYRCEIINRLEMATFSLNKSFKLRVYYQLTNNRVGGCERLRVGLSSVQPTEHNGALIHNRLTILLKPVVVVFLVCRSTVARFTPFCHIVYLLAVN